MSPDEDALLLLLIYEHLKLHGHAKAAEVLEDHVKQVEAPHLRLNLQDIYTAWAKLCALAQTTKLEMEDGASPRKSEEAEAASSEDDSGLDVKASNTTKEENDKTPDPETQQLKPPDGPNASEDGSGSEHLDGQSAATGTSREAPDGPEGSGSEEDLPDAGTSSQVDPGAADGLSAPDLTGSVGVERSADADEPQQETDAAAEVRGETAALEQTDVSQSKATPTCAEEEESPAEDLGQIPLTTPEPVPQETPPPTESEDPEKDEKMEEPQTERSEVADLTVQPDSEGETKTSPKSDDLSLTDLGNNHHRGHEVDVCFLKDDPVRVEVSEEPPTAGAEERVHPGVSIVLNIEKDEMDEQEVTEALPAEAAESCEDVETPRRKKKKKNKKDSDPSSTNVFILEASRDSSISSKKKKDKERVGEVEEQQEEVEEQQEEVVVEKKRKKSKKRKIEQDEVQENLAETPVTSLDMRSKKKKTEVSEEQPEEAEMSGSPAEAPQKKRRRNRKRKKKQGGLEVVQSEEPPAEGDIDPEKELTDGDAPQLPSIPKKRRFTKRLNSMKQQRLLYQQKSSKTSGHKKKQKLIQEDTPRPDAAQDQEKTSKKKKKPSKQQEENSSKENLPPKKKKKKLLPSEDDSGVMSEQTCEILPEKKRKKKKIKAKEDEIKPSSDVPAEKKKKNRSKEAEEAAEELAPPTSTKKKSRKKITSH
ncbi:titin-like isoform X6 [Takifugu flavidus]|uniref:titin-like isoform X6 n=1 Tax=Takifugu flavidus TaxID=433684 RepID=UPI00254460B1|nr:titin-like isoform X6 [Takifugu flavidus]